MKMLHAMLFIETLGMFHNSVLKKYNYLKENREISKL